MTDHSTNQLALFMNARDHRDYGTAAWADLDIVGQEAYLADATALVTAVKALGWVPADADAAELREVIAGADHTAAKYWRRMQEAEREMHARELHHFESEKAISDAVAACDRFLAVKVADSTEADAAAAGVASALRGILAPALGGSVVPEPSVAGWSTEDRREALAEALRRWSVQGQHARVDQRDQDIYGQGARQGFALGAEWWKLTHPVPEPQGEPSDANAGVGWFEWFKMPENTTEIAYVDENGEVFDPQRGWNPVEFTIAAAEGRVHRLVRAVTEQGENREEQNHV